MEELVSSTAIIDHSNMLKLYTEVLILSVLHVPPEKHPTENGVIAEKLWLGIKTSTFSCTGAFTRP